MNSSNSLKNTACRFFMLLLFILREIFIQSPKEETFSLSSCYELDASDHIFQLHRQKPSVNKTPFFAYLGIEMQVTSFFRQWVFIASKLFRRLSYVGF